MSSRGQKPPQNKGLQAINDKSIVKDNLCVIYARFSSDRQRDESIEGQVRDCTAYAERLGMKVVEIYADKAMSGTNDRRPEFQRMIRDSARGQWAAVICWKTDRFARDRYDSITYKAKLRKNGVRVLYAMETVPEGPEGIIVESLMEGFAEYYSANLSQNIKRGNYDSALKRKTLGVTLLGLRADAEDHFEIDPATGPVVKRIFEEYAAGRPTVDIIADLNAEGFRTAKGNEFNKNSLRRIIQNEKYCGVYQYADIRDENGIPAIVSRELWEKAQQISNLHHIKPAAKKIDGGFLLTAKLFCGMCGAPMIGDSGTGKSGKVYQYYSCSTRKRKKTCKKEKVPKQWIEDLVVEELAKIVHSDVIINTFADRFMVWQEEQKPAGVADGLRQRLKETEKSIKNLMAAIEAGIITESTKARLLELEAKRADLDLGIAKAEIEEPKIERDAVVWFLTRFRDGDIQDPAWRIYLVETFLQAAYLYDDGKLILALNFTGEDGTVTVQMAEDGIANGELLCSDLSPAGLPSGAKLNTRAFFRFGKLFMKVAAQK